jgi:uncharacterized protein
MVGASGVTGERAGAVPPRLLYALGQGVSQNHVRASVWFNLAGAQGDTNGTEHRDALAKRMTPAQIAEAHKLAREWRPKTP